MKRTIARMTVKAARKNPRAALSVALFAAHHARGIAKALKFTRRASRALGRARAAEPVVKHEARAAAASLAGAVGRVRKVGVVAAMGDRKVADHLDQALRHASRAFGGARKARRPHNLRGAAAAGVGPLLGAFGAWRLKSRD